MDIVKRHEQLIKAAATPPWLIGAVLGNSRYDALFDKDSDNFVWAKVPSRAGAARDYVYGTMNPFKTKDTVSYNLGKNIADFFLPKVYDPDDLGPYEEYSNYLKETEKAEMLLREAEKLRRKARLEELNQEQEEKNKAHASKSRYF